MKPSQNSSICSEHFKETCYQVRPEKMGCRLKPDVVPSIFPQFLKHLQTVPPQENLQKREKLLSPLYILSLCLPSWLKQIILFLKMEQDTKKVISSKK